MIRAATSFGSEASDSLQVTYTTKNTCPPGIKHAILKLVSALWQNRSVSVDTGVINESDMYNVRLILNSHKTKVWI